MLHKILPFSRLVAKGRWKVEFFVSDGGRAREAAHPPVRLRDVLRERRGALDPQQYQDHLFNYIGLEHIHPATGDLVDGFAPRRGRDVLSRSKTFRRGDVLYGRLRPSLNKVFVADAPAPDGICSGEFYVLVPDRRRILPHFARAMLASRYVQDAVRSMTTGSALPRLGLDDLLEIEIPLPPLEVQEQYQRAIILRNAERQVLTAELRDMQANDLGTIVEALEGGRDLSFDRLSVVRRPPEAAKRPETVARPKQAGGRRPRHDDASRS